MSKRITPHIRSDRPTRVEAGGRRYVFQGGTLRREKPKAKGKAARRAERAARARRRALRTACPDCKVSYPDDLLATFYDEREAVTVRICGIDALTRFNRSATAAGVATRTQFPDGSAQEALRLKAIRFRRQEGVAE